MLAPPMRAAVVCSILVATTPVAAGPVSQDDPKPGIHHEEWVETSIPAKVHLIRLDLSSVELRLVATKEGDAGIKTSTYLTRRTATVAINGGPFSVAGYRPRGLAMGDGQMWADVHDDEQTYIL